MSYAQEQLINPNEDLQIPDWINQSYFEPILAREFENFSQIAKFQRLAATQVGENYCSIMVRVVIDYLQKDKTAQQISYIVKTNLLAGSAGSLMDLLGCFPKEKIMYEKYMPAFEQLYQEAGLQIQLAPKCVHYEANEQHITMVFEDLKQKQFENCNRFRGLNLQHMQNVLRKLAELHAASVVYRELHGDYEELFQKSLYTEAARSAFVQRGNANKALTEQAMRTWPLSNIEYYLQKKPSVESFYDEAIRISEPAQHAFSVLNHGDCWSNNIMFNYKEVNAERQIQQSIFIDFQLSKWGSPAHDLWYLITTSAANDILVSKFDYFLSVYHGRLQECLSALGYANAMPSLRQIHLMMLNYGFWAYIVAMGVMGLILFPNDKDANMECMLKTGAEAQATRFKLLTNSVYVEKICTILPFLDQKGLLDI